MRAPAATIGTVRTSPGATARRLIGHLVAEGPAHRADLSRALGVSRTTITNLVAELADAGVLLPVDGGAPEQTPSDRPPLKQQLGISAGRGVLASAAFHMTSVTIAVGTLDGRLLATGSEDFARDLPGTERMEVGRALLTRILASCAIGTSQVLRLHLAINTQCDRASGEVIAEQAAGPWRGVNPLRLAEQWTSAAVHLENTARLIGLAEYRALGDPGPRSLVYVHLSWGVTMGQVVDGTIVPGSHGGAGELGHVSIDPMGPPCACANRGCLMLYAGLDALTERVRAALGEEAGVPEAVAAIDEGSQACATIVEDAGESVGRALAMVCNVVDPDVIVLGGELAAAGATLGDAVRAEVRRRALPLVTRHLDVSTATTTTDPEAPGRAALTALRGDAALVAELVETVLAE